ncbi:hypothetical protein HDU96_002880, partial [Phlyctochytrium bullatum]
KFAVTAQHAGVARIVGTRTAGGGHPCAFVRAGHPHFTASISIGRTVVAATGKGWEGIGCIPDDVVEGDALEAAHATALRVVLGAMEGAQGMAAMKVVGEAKAQLQDYEAKAKPAEPVAATPAPAETTVTVTVPAEEHVPAPKTGDKKFKHAPGVHVYPSHDGTGTFEKRVVRQYRIFGFSTQYHNVTTLSKEEGEAYLKTHAAYEAH